VIGSDDALDVEPDAGSWPRIGFNVARIVGRRPRARPETGAAGRATAHDPAKMHHQSTMEADPPTHG